MAHLAQYAGPPGSRGWGQPYPVQPPLLTLSLSLANMHILSWSQAMAPPPCPWPPPILTGVGEVGCCFSSPSSTTPPAQFDPHGPSRTPSTLES
jgi:hypothetical protein